MDICIKFEEVPSRLSGILLKRGWTTQRHTVSRLGHHQCTRSSSKLIWLGLFAFYNPHCLGYETCYYWTAHWQNENTMCQSMLLFLFREHVNLPFSDSVISIQIWIALQHCLKWLKTDFTITVKLVLYSLKILNKIPIHIKAMAKFQECSDWLASQKSLKYLIVHGYKWQ